MTSFVVRLINKNQYIDDRRPTNVVHRTSLLLLCVVHVSGERRG